MQLITDEVYPRVCGGTRGRRPPPERRRGLSPRVRGNQQSGETAVIGGGSIPACAGEPSTRSGRPRRAEVYPRVCGGTTAPGSFIPHSLGLSPRVRGNPRTRTRCGGDRWSIPACAGEPRAKRTSYLSIRVYPRVCGGTDCRERSAASVVGLSPRVRGNRVVPAAVFPLHRSIPACAGEPEFLVPWPSSATVYPRVCGGTLLGGGGLVGQQGLSPRVRGNQRPKSRRS